LPEEERSSEEESPLDLLVGSKELEGLPEAETTSGHLTLNVLLNSVDLLLDVDVILGQTSDVAEVLDSLLSVSLGHQPARAFAEPEATDQQHSRGDELNGEWDKPLGVVRFEMGVNSILQCGISIPCFSPQPSCTATHVDPESYQTSNLPSKFEHAD
jgi:hypothetical protein